MLAVYMQGLRLSWLRMLWDVFGLPRALRPGRGIRFSRSGYLYGRRGRQWNRSKSLGGPKKATPTLPAASEAPGKRMEAIARNAAKVSTLGTLSVPEAVTALEGLRDRPISKQPPAPIVVHSLNAQRGHTRISPAPASTMAVRWQSAIMRDWAELDSLHRGVVVCTEYQRGICRPVWHRLVENVDVEALHLGLAQRLERDGLSVTFPVAHVAQTRRDLR